MVCFGDKDEVAGRKLASELTRCGIDALRLLPSLTDVDLLHSTLFVPCDTTKWEDQVRLFVEAAKFSPSGKVHYVVANAGITRQDDVFSFDGECRHQRHLFHGF
jgi:NAD(P)-dependent dehydrogenase (short-subunit alcohol dehydrogenase family)